MKISNINLQQLKRRGLALVAVPVMLLGLTGCKKGENPNRKEEVISEETGTIPVINQTETTSTLTTTVTEPTTTGLTSSSTSASTSKTTTTSTTTTTTTTTTPVEDYAHELLTDSEYAKIMSIDLSTISDSDLLTLIGKGHTPEQATQICNIIINIESAKGNVGAAKSRAVSVALLSRVCASQEMLDYVSSALLTSKVNNIDELGLNDELKDKYIYMDALYRAYGNACYEKDTYLRILDGAKIIDATNNMDQLLIKNKITSEQRLNYFVSYENGELKESNLMLGDSLLKDYFEEMRYYVCSENYADYCTWSSTDFAIRNAFDMLEEEFVVEKMDGKYIALKIDQKENTKVVK